jgi:phosphoglycolate phosphatase-like HAD superfamily hydrolase
VSTFSPGKIDGNYEHNLGPYSDGLKFTNIIFDFDHTLVEFGPHVDWKGAIQAIERVYLEEGIPVAVVEQSKGLGFSLMRAVYNHMLGVFPAERVHRVQSRAFAALEGYELLGVEKALPVDGAKNLLAWLESSSVQCAIVSSNATRVVESSLRHLGLDGFFRGVFGRDPSCRLKPYPDQNRLCLSSLGWKAEGTLLIGDSPDDILSAKPLSIFTVGIVSDAKREQRLLDSGPDRLIRNLSELPFILQTA